MMSGGEANLKKKEFFFFNSREKHRERERMGRGEGKQRERGGELSMEPYAGPNPRTPRIWSPEPKSDT